MWVLYLAGLAHVVMVRVPPETHRALSIQAAEAGISLNRLACSKLSR